MKYLCALVGLVVVCSAGVLPTNASAQAPGVLWEADMETGNLTQWYAPDTKEGNNGGGLYNSGGYGAVATTYRAHTGRYSMKAQIWSPPAAGVRAFRWRELRTNRDLYVGAWYYLPERYRLTADPCCGRYWDLFQFKSRTTGSAPRIDPFWLFSADMASDGSLFVRAGWGWGGVTVPGPFATSLLGGKNYTQRIAPVPIGRWFHLEAFIRQSSGYDGTLTFWQDGVKLFDFRNIRTSYRNCDFNSWCADNEWSVNSYSDGLSPSPSTLYVDDAAIGTQRVP